MIVCLLIVLKEQNGINHFKWRCKYFYEYTLGQYQQILHKRKSKIDNLTYFLMIYFTDHSIKGLSFSLKEN